MDTVKGQVVFKIQACKQKEQFLLQMTGGPPIKRKEKKRNFLLRKNGYL